MHSPNRARFIDSYSRKSKDSFFSVWSIYQPNCLILRICHGNVNSCLNRELIRRQWAPKEDGRKLVTYKPHSDFKMHVFIRSMNKFQPSVGHLQRTKDKNSDINMNSTGIIIKSNKCLSTIQNFQLVKQKDVQLRKESTHSTVQIDNVSVSGTSAHVPWSWARYSTQCSLGLETADLHGHFLLFVVICF